MGTKTQKQRKCCYHNLNAKQLIIVVVVTTIVIVVVVTTIVIVVVVTTIVIVATATSCPHFCT